MNLRFFYGNNLHISEKSTNFAVANTEKDTKR